MLLKYSTIEEGFNVTRSEFEEGSSIRLSCYETVISLPSNGEIDSLNT